MHISTHHDPIWQTGCQTLEDDIIKRLSSISNQVLVKPIDAVAIDPVDLDCYDLVVTDNRFITAPSVPIIDLGPEFWGIYHMEPVTDTILHPTKFFNCMMNRISGERLRIFYILAQRGLLTHGHVSLNCLYHDLDPDQEQRRQNYDRVRSQCGWSEYADIHQQYRDQMPLLNDLDPTQAAIDSLFTIVVESYVSDWLIAVSEKIFRALQTPRPWVVFSSPGTVAMLRETGFDVLDDQVQHWRYDSIVDPDARMKAVIEQISNHTFDRQRLRQAAQHNSQFLAKLKDALPARVDQVSQSILDWHHPISNSNDLG